MDIILDKSFLIGVSGKNIKELCESNVVFFTEVLCYELLTTTAKERTECLNKLPNNETRLIMTTNSGVLMRAECLNRQPCNLKDGSGLIQPDKFLKDMKDEKFVDEENYVSILTEWKSFVDDTVKTFKFISGHVAIFFPELKKIKGGESKEVIQFALDELSGDSQKVLEVYEAIMTKEIFPPTVEIDSKWIIYRTLQTYLIAAVEYVRKYGSGTLNAESKKIENDVMDIEYCIFACLTNHLASRDKGLVNMYKLSNPNGCILN